MGGLTTVAGVGSWWLFGLFKSKKNEAVVNSNLVPIGLGAAGIAAGVYGTKKICCGAAAAAKDSSSEQVVPKSAVAAVIASKAKNHWPEIIFGVVAIVFLLVLFKSMCSSKKKHIASRDSLRE